MRAGFLEPPLFAPPFFPAAERRADVAFELFDAAFFEDFAEPPFLEAEAFFEDSARAEPFLEEAFFEEPFFDEAFFADAFFEDGRLLLEAFFDDFLDEPFFDALFFDAFFEDLREELFFDAAMLCLLL